MRTLSELSPFSWGGIELSEVAHIMGVPWATRKAIGEWLEYTDPEAAVGAILSENPYIEEQSKRLSMKGVDENYQDVPVYHPLAFFIIASESGQPKAEAMKVALSDFMGHFIRAQQSHDQQMADMRHRGRVLTSDLSTIDPESRREFLMADLIEISHSLGLPVPEVEGFQVLAVQPAKTTNGEGN
jgi:hypothetical protein